MATETLSSFTDLTAADLERIAKSHGRRWVGRSGIVRFYLTGLSAFAGLQGRTLRDERISGNRAANLARRCASIKMWIEGDELKATHSDDEMIGEIIEGLEMLTAEAIEEPVLIATAPVASGWGALGIRYDERCAGCRRVSDICNATDHCERCCQRAA